MRALLLTLAFLSISTATRAQEDPISEKACADVSALKIPKVQPLNQADLSFLESCDPADLYYGVQGHPDYPAARRCALYKLQTYKPYSNREEDILPTAVAAMIYANGQGVPPDPKLALHLFCAYDDANPQYLYAYLFLTARPKPQSNTFDLCAMDAGKLIGRVCESIQYKHADNIRLAALRPWMANWSPAQMSAYAAMTKVHDAYIQAATNEAIEACITGVADEAMEYRDQLAKEFEDDVDSFSRGNLPTFTHADYLSADRDLNTAYETQMSALTNKQGNCAKTPRSLQTGERAWIPYRDAWLKFAQVRWPQVSADSWLTFLTRERTTHIYSVPVE